MSELFGKLSEKLSGLSESPPSKPGEKSTVHKLDLQHATRDQLVEFAKRQHNHIKQIESHYKALKAKTAEEKNHIAQQELLIPTLQQRIRELEQEVMLYSAELSAMKSTRDDGSSDDENDNAFFAQSAVKRLADLRGQFIEEDKVRYQKLQEEFNLQTDLLAKTTMEKQLMADQLSNLTETNQSQLKQLEALRAQDQGSMQSLLAETESAHQTLQAEHTQTKQRIMTLEDEKNKLERTQNQTISQEVHDQTQIQVEKQLHILTQQHHQEELQHRAHLQEAETKYNVLEEEYAQYRARASSLANNQLQLQQSQDTGLVDKMKAKLTNQKERISQLELEAQDSIKQAQDLKGKLSLMSQLQEEHVLLMGKVSDAKLKEDEYRAKNVKRQAEHAHQISQLQEEHQAIIDDMNNKHVEAMQVVKTQLAEARSQNESSLTKLNTEISSLKDIIEVLKLRSESQGDDFLSSEPADFDKKLNQVTSSRGDHVVVLKLQVEELKMAADESERMLALYAAQEKVLKEEIRKLERKEKREDYYNAELVKNLLVQYIDSDDPQTLIPVFNEVFQFSPAELARVKSKFMPSTSPSITDKIWSVFGSNTSSSSP